MSRRRGTKRDTGVTTTDEDQALVDAEDDTHAAQARAKLPRPDPNPVSPNDEEVFNVSNNVYTFEDAPAVCKAFNARLATPEEVEKAWKQGADWCNYGWTEGQQALYPTQQATYDKLQGSEEHAHDCGVVGVNGGYFENPELQFGVNCYGKKPEPRLQEKELIGYFPDYISDKEPSSAGTSHRNPRVVDDVTVLPQPRAVGREAHGDGAWTTGCARTRHARPQRQNNRKVHFVRPVCVCSLQYLCLTAVESNHAIAYVQTQRCIVLQHDA